MVSFTAAALALLAISAWVGLPAFYLSLALP
jgi:hypothetical protein